MKFTNEVANESIDSYTDRLLKRAALGLPKSTLQSTLVNRNLKI